MKKFYVAVANDEGDNGTWEIPEHLFDTFKGFMLALQSGNEGEVRWNGPASLGVWTVRPRLLHWGDRKIRALKEVRSFYGLNLKDAKALVDKAPCDMPPLPYAKAVALKNAFEEGGCGTIELPSILERLAAELG